MPLKALNFQISSEKYECHRGLDLKSSFSLVLKLKIDVIRKSYRTYLGT